MGQSVAQRAIERDKEAVDGISFFGRNASADEITHQHRDKRDRKSRCRGHRVGLGKGERREEPSLLRFEREHRNEREGDDQQRNEKRRPDLRRRLADRAPAFLARERRARVRVMPGFEALVRVLDHHHRGVDHRADGDRDAAERHDVGVHPLVIHDDECGEDAERQRNDGDERRA
jgi:hypothetical protein